MTPAVGTGARGVNAGHGLMPPPPKVVSRLMRLASDMNANKSLASQVRETKPGPKSGTPVPASAYLTAQLQVLFAPETGLDLWAKPRNRVSKPEAINVSTVLPGVRK